MMVLYKYKPFGLRVGIKMASIKEIIELTPFERMECNHPECQQTNS